MILSLPERSCPICHDSFIVRGGKGRPRLFCSDKCRDVDRRIRDEKKDRIKALENSRQRLLLRLEAIEKELTTLLSKESLTHE